MNIALLTAGGSGTRMLQDIPKQFMTINDKPIIIYTMEIFEKHPAIDKIIVACKEGWENILESYAKQFGISKLDKVIQGGKTGHESIRKMLNYASENYDDNDIVLVHDGNRPMLSTDIISNSISVCKQKGCAIAQVPCNDALLYTENKISSTKQISRDLLVRTQTPHTFKLKDLLDMHLEAEKMGINNSVASCTLAIELGKKVYFTPGSEKNIKITVPEDIEIFKALLNVENREEK